jgi:hypothetical protein
LFFIDTDQLFSAARVFPEAIVGNPIKPGRKPRFAPKTADVFVGAHKSVLCQIVGEGEVSAGKLAEETSHSRLMPAHQLAKSVLVIIDKNSGDEVRISELHVSMLLRRRRWWNVLLSLQFPHQ